MKKVWMKPELEILNIGMTMNGNGKAIPDCYDVSDGFGESELSNAKCKDRGKFDS